MAEQAESTGLLMKSSWRSPRRFTRARMATERRCCCRCGCSSLPPLGRPALPVPLLLLSYLYKHSAGTSHQGFSSTSPPGLLLGPEGNQPSTETFILCQNVIMKLENKQSCDFASFLCVVCVLVLLCFKYYFVDMILFVVSSSTFQRVAVKRQHSLLLGVIKLFEYESEYV